VPRAVRVAHADGMVHTAPPARRVRAPHTAHTTRVEERDA